MTLEKQGESKVIVRVSLHRDIGHDKDRTPFWTVSVIAHGVDGNSIGERLISIQNIDDEERAEKTYYRTKLHWGVKEDSLRSDGDRDQ
jgi:hypothetical protein